MGERIVLCGCKFCDDTEFTKFGEIVVIEYYKACGSKLSKTFSGMKSYIIQSALHELEKCREITV